MFIGKVAEMKGFSLDSPYRCSAYAADIANERVVAIHYMKLLNTQDGSN